tara:strand:- start:393 stop:761 length:369 start_codon:yes stop_codon:yes gene_type:complete
LPDGTIGQADRQTVAFQYSGILAGAVAVSISVTLTDASNLPIASLTGLRWAWWDSSTLSTQVAPVIKGSGATTDTSGVFSVTTLTGSALTAGQVGWIEVSDSDGTTSQSPVAKVAAGPVPVS